MYKMNPTSVRKTLRNPPLTVLDLICRVRVSRRIALKQSRFSEPMPAQQTIISRAALPS